MPKLWTTVYPTPAERVHAPTGKLHPRPFQGGQKIGRMSTLNNAVFGAQAKTKVFNLATYLPPGMATTAVVRERVLDVSTPSTRLRCGIQLYLEPFGIISDEPVAAGVVPGVASLYSMGVNPNTGSRGSMNIVGTFGIPSHIPIDPVYREARLIMQLASENFAFSGAFVGGGNLKAYVNWEPVAVDMTSDELNRLYTLCNASASATVEMKKV